MNDTIFKCGCKLIDDKNIKENPDCNLHADKKVVVVKDILETINNYSSASSRAENEYQRGISAGIEMFRKYLLKGLK